MKKQYKVFFEVFGKKMQTTVMADNKNEAKRKVLEKVKFHKVAEDDFYNEAIDLLNKILK